MKVIFTKNFILSKFNNLYKKLFDNATYLIRLDDACETHDQQKWSKIEEILDRHDIKPIVAVIPRNKDQSLKIDPINYSFWDMVLKWQKKGWIIALHGYSHEYKKVNKRNLIFPYYDRSEFGGLAYKYQEEKIVKGYDIMLKNNISPKIWIAPSHTFDKNTIKILLRKTNIKIISDGISLFPFRRHGILFIPQQLWKFKQKKRGLWTICLHPNNLNNKEFSEIENLLNNKFFSKKFKSLEESIKKEKNIGIFSIIFRIYFWNKLRIKDFFKFFLKN